jgi:hypothetical protein
VQENFENTKGVFKSRKSKNRQRNGQYSCQNQNKRTNKKLFEIHIQTLENAEGTIKNGQFRDNGNIRHKRHMTKARKTKIITQHRKLTS